MNEIATIQPESTALAVQNPIAGMLQAVIDGGVTAESAVALEKLVGLYERMEATNAAKAFAAAKVALQSELPTVRADKIIPTKTGEIRSTFASYGAIMEAIDPHLVKHGFSVSFNIRVEPSAPPRITAICKLTHVAGHSEMNEFSVRVGQGPPGCSEAQADGAARSYARRGALCDALNIVVDHDTDARNLGSFISPEQVTGLRARMAATGTDQARFLKFAGASSLEEIHSTRYAVLDDALRKKERDKPKPSPKPVQAQGEDPEAMDKQDFVVDCRQRRQAATTEAEVRAILDDVRKNEDWLGVLQATALRDEIGGRK